LRAVIAKPLAAGVGASAARVDDDMLSSGGGAGGMAATMDISTACARARAAAVPEIGPARPELLIAI